MSYIDVLIKLMRKGVNWKTDLRNLFIKQKREIGIWRKGQNYLEEGRWDGKVRRLLLGLQMNRRDMRGSVKDGGERRGFGFLVIRINFKVALIQKRGFKERGRVQYAVFQMGMLFRKLVTFQSKGLF